MDNTTFKLLDNIGDFFKFIAAYQKKYNVTLEWVKDEQHYGYGEFLHGEKVVAAKHFHIYPNYSVMSGVVDGEAFNNEDFEI